MDVLHVVADGTPGGGTTAVLGLIEDLSTRGWTTGIVTDRDSYAAEQARGLGVPVKELNFFASRFDPRIGADIRREIERVSPRIVHTHGARAALPLSFRRRISAAHVHTVHGFHFLGKKPLAKTLAVVAERVIAEAADASVFVSQADASVASQYKIRPKVASVIYNGVAFDDIPVPGDTKVYDLVFSGRLHRQKNPLFLLDVVSHLRGKNYRFCLIGDGDMREAVTRGIEDRGLGSVVSYLGGLSRSRALDMVSKSRLFILPSLWEGLPIAPIEALACGVPVVASDIPGTREVVETNVCGCLIPGYDAAEWARALSKLLDDHTSLQKMSVAASNRARDLFERSVMTDNYVKVYDSVTDPFRP